MSNDRSDTATISGGSAEVLSFVLTVEVDDVDLASDRLWQLGVRAVEERTSPSADMVELWTAVGDDPEALRRAAAVLEPQWSWRTEEMEVAAAETWREFAAPMWIADDVVIVPAWQQVPGEIGENVTQVLIEPGGAFGLGDHPTTALSLEALLGAMVGGDLSSARPSVLDVGCGTGVLSVAAAMLGADHVRAVDIADAAVDATVDNAQRNDVAGAITVDTTEVSGLHGDFDIVLANILAPALIAMSDELKRLTGPSGCLIISGILADNHAHVLAALEPMTVVDTLESDGWVAVTLRH